MANTIDNMARCGVAWFKMDEASGSLVDSKGVFVGTNTGATVVAGFSGNARSFNGTSQYITINGKVLPAGRKSIRFKINAMNKPSNFGVILGNGYSTTEYGTIVQVESSGYINVVMLKGVSGESFSLTTPFDVCDGQWHDVLITWDGTTSINSFKVYIDDMVTPKGTGTPNFTQTVDGTSNLTIGKRSDASDRFFNGVLDEIEVYNDVISGIPDKVLIYHDGMYKYFANSWQTIGSTVTENDYIAYGMNDISKVSEKAWGELSGTVELCCYSDHAAKSEVQWNIYTEPYTVADELKDQTISVIEYTDDPLLTESIATIETEPFSLYEDMGDSFDLLYYTNDPSKTTVELEITANYSPLDEIHSDFDLVAWTDELASAGDVKFANIAALPIAQLVLNQSDIVYFGDFQRFVASKIATSSEGVMRFILSFDSGVSWQSYKYKEWIPVNVEDTTELKRKGLKLEELNSIEIALLSKMNNTTRLGYYLDEFAHKPQDTKIDEVKVISKASINDVKFSDLAFYLLNTTATINLTYAGNKLKGQLSDVDMGKVKYRVFLNGNPYYPATGQFSNFFPSPHNINIVIDDRLINFGVQNTLKVEFQDYWGQIDSWTSTFIGTHSGLVFTDEMGSFYTTAFGEVLRYLDFGAIIAGQTTLDHKVVLKNNIGYDVKNVRLTAIQPTTSGVTVELSKEQSPFIPSLELVYPEDFYAGDEIPFYVRLTTELTAQETPAGKFEIRVNADKVV